MLGKVITLQNQPRLVNQEPNYQGAAQISSRVNYIHTMRTFSTDIPHDRNIYGDNTLSKKDDYVIPDTVREINVLWDDVLFC